MFFRYLAWQAQSARAELQQLVDAVQDLPRNHNGEDDFSATAGAKYQETVSRITEWSHNWVKELNDEANRFVSARALLPSFFTRCISAQSVRWNSFAPFTSLRVYSLLAR